MAKKSFWPYGLTLSTLAVIGICVYTVNISLENKPVMDTYYLMSKKQLDGEMNELLESAKRFDERFDVRVKIGALKSVSNETSLTIYDKTTKEAIQNAHIEVLITRPDSDEFDIRPVVSFVENVYQIGSFDLPKLGRWKLLVKIKANGLVKFLDFERYARS